MKSKNKKLIKEKIQIAFIIMFIMSILYICNEYYDKYKDKQDNEYIINMFYEENNQLFIYEEATEIMREEKSEKILRLERLNNINSDIIGFIRIEGTNINYPVLQSLDNSFYLTHNYKREYSKSGSVFLDKDVNIDSTGMNYLIYGHRNRHGLMFEELVNYKEEEFYKSHPIINLTTLKDDKEYEIISVFLSQVYNKKDTDAFKYYQITDLGSKEVFDYYIKKAKESALYKIDKTAVYGDDILTLSTCEYSKENGRLAIVARRIK